MKKQICTYNPEVLVGLAQDFINAEMMPAFFTGSTGLSQVRH